MKFDNNNKHFRILKGMCAVAFFMLIGKFAGAFKEMAVAYRYGVSEIVDAYAIVYSIVTMLPLIWTGVLALVLVPLLKSLDIKERDQFSAELLFLTAVLALVGATVTYFLAPLLVPIIWDEFTLQAQEQLIALFLGLTPMLIGMFFCAQFAARLLALEQHSNTLMEAFPSLILGVLVLLNFVDNPVLVFVLGSDVGVLVQLIGLTLLLFKQNALTGISFRFQSAAWIDFRQAFGVMVLSFLLMSLVAPIDIYFASQIGVGEVSTYGYAKRVIFLFLGLGATAVGRAILPVLSDISDSMERKKVASQWALMLFLLGVLALLIAWVIMPTLIEVLFQRGAFVAEDTRRVASAARYALFQFPMYFGGIVLAQYFASQERFVILFQSSAIALVFKIAFVSIGSAYLGLAGVMLSTAIMYLATFSFLLYKTHTTK